MLPKIFLFIILMVLSVNVDCAEVHRFVSSNAPHTNTYLITGEQGSIVIDPAPELSEAIKVQAFANALHRPIKAILITHPHFDHFGGVGHYINDNEILVASLQSVNRDADMAYQQSEPFLKKYYATQLAKFTPINRVLKDKETLVIDDLQITVSDYGAGESSSSALFTLDSEKVAFVGDLIFSNRHYWLAEGRVEGAIKQLNRLAQNIPEDYRLYTGHGEPVIFQAIHKNIKYINDITDFVGKHKQRPIDEPVNIFLDLYLIFLQLMPYWQIIF